jgi:hypothetical protein
MTNVSARILALSFCSVVMSAPLLSAQDLSQYREFQLGMSLATAAQKSGVTREALPHQPAKLIQELIWQPPRGIATSPPEDSVRKVILSFYNDQLFRIAVSYEWERTEGLTVEDMIAALSATYGPPTLPNPDLIPLLSRGGAADSDRILAHWEDAQSSLNLVRPSYASTYGLVIFSKRLDALARAATVQSLWLDDQESSARAIGRKRSQDDADHARQEQVRARNKAAFRF